MFVSAAVLVAVAPHIAGHGVTVDRVSFFRDSGILLLALAAVVVILAFLSPPVADDPIVE